MKLKRNPASSACAALGHIVFAREGELNANTLSTRHQCKARTSTVTAGRNERHNQLRKASNFKHTEPAGQRVDCLLNLLWAAFLFVRGLKGAYLAHANRSVICACLAELLAEGGCFCFFQSHSHFGHSFAARGRAVALHHVLAGWHFCNTTVVRIRKVR